MPPSLTRKQRAVLDAIEAFAKENAYMPSVRELAARLDLGVATTHFHLSSLQAKGYLEHDGTAHGLQLKEPALQAQAPEPSPAADGGGVRLPVVGVIAAGRPIEAIEFYFE
jgi:repressor LexA